MKGFILKLNRAKGEDMVVTVLSEHNVGTYYRFYGARHSVLQLGYLIDFEVEQDKANFLPRLRGVTHIGFPWLYDRAKLMDWHRFISIFEPHFRDVNEITSFPLNPPGSKKAFIDFDIARKRRLQLTFFGHSFSY